PRKGRCHPLVLAALACALSACRSDPLPAPPPDVPACTSPDVRVIGPAQAPADATLVMLHGYGANAADIEPVARALSRASPHLAVLVPDGCDPRGGSPTGREWWPYRREGDTDRAATVRKAALRVSRFVDAELARRGLPRDRVAWAGFSQGAILSQWMAVHGEPQPIAAVSFSGRFDDDASDDPVTTPVLLVHGEHDAMIPFAEVGLAQRALAARGAKVERLDRPAMGHNIDGESLNAAVAFLARSLGAR